MPIEPPPSVFELPSAVGADGDVVAVGGELSAGLVLEAYRGGMFPMYLRDGHLGWWCPIERAVLEPADLRITRSLRQSCRRYQLSVDSDFEGVMMGCADPRREGSWITRDFLEVYAELHRLGWAHSIEVWDQDGQLAGGLYGVSLGGLFAGESMFHRSRDASKVALVHLTGIMASRPGSLIDVQWQTEHLRSLGTGIIGKRAYLDRLPGLLAMPSPFSDPSASASR